MELERKRKEEEEQAEQLEAAARKKANAVAQALLEGHMGCDLCLRLGELIPFSVAVHIFKCLSAFVRVRVFSHQGWSRCGMRGMSEK